MALVAQRMHLKYWRPQGFIADGAVQDLELHGDAGGGAILPLAATPFLLRFRSSFTGGAVAHLPTARNPPITQELLAEGVREARRR